MWENNSPNDINIRITQCLGCLNSISDPDCGYTCKLELWKYFDKGKCPCYQPDIEYIEHYITTELRRIREKIK